MKLEIDSLKCVKLLTSRGWNISDAEAVVEAFTDIDFRNVYDKQEVTTMLSEAVQKVFDNADKRFDEERRSSDKRLDEERRSSEKHFELLEKRIESDRQESINSRRWMTGIIVTAIIALAGYLSALIHISH